MYMYMVYYELRQINNLDDTVEKTHVYITVHVKQITESTLDVHVHVYMYVYMYIYICACIGCILCT